MNSFFPLQSWSFYCTWKISKLSEELNAGFVIITISSPAPVHLTYPLGNRAKQRVSIPSGYDVAGFPFSGFPDHPGLLFIDHYGLLLGNSGLLCKYRQDA